MRDPVEMRDGILVFAPAAEVNWSDELEALHGDATRDHFMDVQTRRAVVSVLADRLPRGGTAVDVGCSSGLLLAELHGVRPDAALVGVDLVAGGLERARSAVPEATLALADATDLPFDDASVDAVAATNVLEHVPDDLGALRELARVLRPGGCAAVVVPRGRRLYDYYDAALGHERRYGRGELARRGREAGLVPVAGRRIGGTLFPAFWLVKKLHRRETLSADAARARVVADIARTRASRAGALLCGLEARLPVSLPFGIRELVVLEQHA